jgi:hypothetical protein
MPDRNQVGLTSEAAEQLIQLREDTSYFAEEADVYRVAVAIALAKNASVPEKLRQASVTTKFRTVKVDMDSDDELPRLDSVDRKLARMVELFYPESAGEPYRYSQFLAVIGISYLHGELIDRRRTLSQAIADAQQ